MTLTLFLPNGEKLRYTNLHSWTAQEDKLTFSDERGLMHITTLPWMLHEDVEEIK